MPPISPRATHLLDQLIAYHLDVQARLKAFERDLLQSGYTANEAWALARELEERLLGPLMDYTAKAEQVEEAIDRLIRQRLDEL